MNPTRSTNATRRSDLRRTLRLAGLRVWTSVSLIALVSRIAACSSEQNRVEPPLPPRASSSDGGRKNPPSEIEEFSARVDELQGIVNLLAQTPPLSEGEGVRRAIDRLTVAIAGIPGPPQPARAEAAKLMRSRDFDVWISLIRADATAGAVREVLVIGAGALTLSAEGLYSTPIVKDAAARLRAAVERLDGTRPLREQRSQILPALRAALEVLTAIRAAAPAVLARQAVGQGQDRF